jgi:hypothetical protein
MVQRMQVDLLATASEKCTESNSLEGFSTHQGVPQLFGYVDKLLHTTKNAKKI